MRPLGESEPKGWVLYDGSCGFCSRWARFWEGMLKRRGFPSAPLQADWVGDRFDLPHGELASDFRLLLADGKQLAGAAAYRYLMRCIWWTWPLYLISILPIFRTFFDLGYRLFADNRYFISRACHLPAVHQAKSARKD